MFFNTSFSSEEDTGLLEADPTHGSEEVGMSDVVTDSSRQVSVP